MALARAALLLLGTLPLLGSTGCASPNSPGLHRDAVVRRDDPFATWVAHAVNLARVQRGLEPSTEALVPLVADPAAVPIDEPALAAFVTAGRDDFLDRLEDLVEGTLSDLLGEEVDAASPREDLTWGRVQVYDRETGAQLADRPLRIARKTPAQAWALAYLATHLGPERLARVDPRDPSVSKFTELVAAYAVARDDLAASQRSMARDIEQELYAQAGLTADEAAEHDGRYDGLVRSAAGLTYQSLLGSSISLRLRNANWSVRSLLDTWFHEFGHVLIFERMGLVDRINYLVSRDLEQTTINENACEVVAALALRHAEAERLGSVDPQRWIGALAIHTRPTLTLAQYERLDGLYATPRLQRQGAVVYNSNRADAALEREYHSLEDQLMAVGEHYGLAGFLACAARLETRAEVDLAVEAVEADLPLEELLERLD